MPEDTPAIPRGNRRVLSQPGRSTRAAAARGCRLLHSTDIPAEFDDRAASANTVVYSHGTVWTMSASSTCERLGGVAATHELLESGIRRRELRRALDAGELECMRRGTYALASLDPTIKMALRHGGVIACASAARLRGLWTLDEAHGQHIWVHSDARTHAHDECECIVHRGDGERTRLIATVVDSLRQIFSCLGQEAFFAALESARRKGLLTKSALLSLRRTLPGRGRRLIDYSRSDADSGLESLIRLRLHRLGIEAKTQVSIRDVGIVDLVIGDCLLIEADGGTHGGDHRHRDLRRDAIATALGLVTLRFDYALIIHDWPIVEAAILEALARGRHRDAGTYLSSAAMADTPRLSRPDRRVGRRPGRTERL